uniref:B30.2/SPRY domain-containing protein n=1 Tax=Zosterops lateralis melanops TaxID=1220523 RepID=A0A8D2PBT4_ZOSLA
MAQALDTALDVILDPETAHPDLTVSEDRKSVRRGSKKLLLSLFDNPKRFGTTPVVLGSPGFFSGRHYWEVQVGDKPEWGLGLCREAAGRKGSILFSPNNGYWVLRLQNGGTYEALTVPVSPLTLSVRPRRVGIFLDYEAGEISFYNVSDPQTLQCSPLVCPSPGTSLLLQAVLLPQGSCSEWAASVLLEEKLI